MVWISPEKLVQKLSARCNYLDTNIVMQVYQALLTEMLETLRDKEEFLMPDWGKFYIGGYGRRKIGLFKEHPGELYSQRVVDYHEPMRVLRFKPIPKLKRYVRTVFKPNRE